MNPKPTILNFAGCCLISLVLLLAGSCSSVKSLPADDYLFMGGKVVRDSQRIEKSIITKMELYIKPKPNSRILGIPYRLYLYNAIKEPKKQKGLLYKAKHSWGQAPVLLSESRPNIIAKKMEEELFSRGYLRPVVNSSIERKGRKATILFTPAAGERYRIRNIIYPNDSTGADSLIRASVDKSILKKGDYFDLAVFRAERERIANLLKEHGYFYFEPDYLLYRVDSLHQGYTDLHITLKEETPPVSLKLWTIGPITIYNNYTLEKDSSIMKLHGTDEKRFILVDPKKSYKPSLFTRTVSLHQGQLYSTSRHSLTIERLMNLGTFKFVKLDFQPAKDSSGSQLNTRIFLTPARKQSLRFELSGNSKSNNYLGSEISINYKNVNVNRGAEILDAKLALGTDVQVGGKNSVSSNTYTLNGEINYYIPRLIPRFKVHTYHNPYLPRTVITPGIEYSKRTDLYTVRSLRFSMGYIWKKGKAIEQDLRIISFNSLNPLTITQKMDSILAQDASLRASFQKQILVGMRYRFSYNNTYRTQKKLNIAFDGNISTSGVTAGLLVKKDGDTVGSKKVLGIPLAQFVRFQVDFRAYWQISKVLTLANRAIIGLGIAYGNSSNIPYSEQFFIGGSSSIRAFRARTLGPGSYHTTNSVYQAYESGDFKTEFNSELRYNMSKYLKLAAFVDGGNIWYRNELPDKPGSGLHGGEFFQEMALGAGIGFRFDASVLVLRFDLATPLRKPWYPIGERWVIHEIDLGNKAWRKDNLLLNIGIGYPF